MERSTARAARAASLAFSLSAPGFLSPAGAADEEADVVVVLDWAPVAGVLAAVAGVAAELPEDGAWGR